MTPMPETDKKPWADKAPPGTPTTLVGAPSGANAKPPFAAKAAPTPPASPVGAPSGANGPRFHGHDLRKGRYSCANQAYLITTVTHNRKSFFKHFECAQALVHTLRQAVEQGWARSHAYVLMPDHLHWIMSLGQGHGLSAVIARVKGDSSRRINQRLGRTGTPVWQRGFHDHALRAEEDLKDIARYVLANLLRAGLATRLGDYPWWDAEWL